MWGRHSDWEYITIDFWREIRYPFRLDMGVRSEILAAAGFNNGNIIIFPVPTEKRNESPNPQDQELENPVFRKKAQSIKNRVWEILCEIGACDNNRFANIEEESFFNERVAAYFLTDVYRREKNTDPALQTYLADCLPVPVTFREDSSLEEVDLVRAIDRAALDTYLSITDDANHQGKQDKLLLYIGLPLLGGKMATMPYKPSPNLAANFNICFQRFQGERSDIQTLFRSHPKIASE